MTWVSHPIGSEALQVRGTGRGRSAVGVLHLDPCPWPGLGREGSADAKEYPLRPHLSCEQNNHRRAVRVL
jgi:hypothetical protein